MVNYHSRFGGLWIDDTDTDAVQRHLQDIGDVELRAQVADFVRDGFVVIPGAVPHAAIDAYLAAYYAAGERPGFFQMEVPSEGGRQGFQLEKTIKPGTKVLDTAMLLPGGDALCFAPKIARFLDAVFEEKALAFQTLHFEVGSTQAIHQDTAYVVVEHQPLRLVASWIALQDVQEGTGELIYYVGGHRMREHPYAQGTSKNWDPPRDGNEPHNAHLQHLHAEAAAAGYPLGRFLPKKGDVLLWHADLPHGGSEITRPGSARRSLVTHYCPKSMVPHYWFFIPPEWQRKTEVRDQNAFVSLYFPPERFAANAQHAAA